MARLPGGGAVVDVLERRTLLSDAGFTWSLRTDGMQRTLVVDGTSSADDLRISASDAGTSIAGGTGEPALVSGVVNTIEVHAGSGDDRVEVTGAVAARLYGDRGDDTLIGGSGADQLFAGAGGGALSGRGGDDTLVATGAGAAVSLSGGDGSDSFWYTRRKGQTAGDVTEAEKQIGAVHAMPLEPYAQAPQGRLTRSNPQAPGGDAPVDLPDPAVTSSAYVYQDFGSRPLFPSAGPSPDDPDQGRLSDCYLLATLSAVAQVMPETLRHVIADMGDGTYAVRFQRGSSELYVRVDADLPTQDGKLVYAGLGTEGSTWAALVEKAYVSYRRGGRGYASLNGGWMSETLKALGVGAVSFKKIRNADQLLTLIQSLLDDGKAVTYASKYPKGGPLVAVHAYSVDSVVADASGRPMAVRLRNPWGVDGVGNDGADDGYVTVTGEQALKAFWAVQASKLPQA